MSAPLTVIVKTRGS